MNNVKIINAIGCAIRVIKKGLKEMSEDKDDTCSYPLCDNCGECYFSEALKCLEEAIK